LPIKIPRSKSGENKKQNCPPRSGGEVLTMLFWIIFGGIVAAVFLLLWCPLVLRFDYAGGGVKLSLRYLVFRARFLPAKEKKSEESPRRKARKRKPKPEKKADRTVMETLRSLWELAGASRRGLRILRRGIVITRLNILASIGGADAHQAAENYGKLAAALFPALGILGTMFTVREPSVYIAPHVVSPHSVFEVSLRVRIRLTTILAAGISSGVHYIKVLSRKKRDGQEVKGGKQYERKTSHQ
jgi:hypothetical protein